MDYADYLCRKHPNFGLFTFLNVIPTNFENRQLSSRACPFSEADMHDFALLEDSYFQWRLTVAARSLGAALPETCPYFVDHSSTAERLIRITPEGAEERARQYVDALTHQLIRCIDKRTEGAIMRKHSAQLCRYALSKWWQRCEVVLKGQAFGEIHHCMKQWWAIRKGASMLWAASYVLDSGLHVAGWYLAGRAIALILAGLDHQDQRQTNN